MKATILFVSLALAGCQAPKTIAPATPAPAMAPPTQLVATSKAAPDMPAVTASEVWQRHAPYLRVMLGKIQSAWEAYMNQNKTYPVGGTYVVVKFVVNAEGRVVRVSEVDNHSSSYGAKAAVSAVTLPGPFGAWTPDMRRDLGSEQELTFTFKYL